MVRVGLYLACYPQLEESWDYVPPLGLGYLAAYARRHVEGKLDFVYERRLEDLLAHRPDLVCLSYVTHNASLARRDAERIKQELGVPVLVGGPHVSTLPERLEEPFDLAVLGEGEQTFADLMRLWMARGRFEPAELARIPGLLYRGEGGVLVRTPARPFIQDLDTVPYPARDLMVDQWRREGKPLLLQVMTSRGCPYDCAFCSTIALWGQRLRCHGIRHVVDEIALLRERYGPATIDIFDDLYVVRKERVMEINRMLRERSLHEGVTFTCFARSNLLDEELMEDMARTNFTVIHVGFESGSDRVLDTFNKQAADMAHNREAIRLARATGIQYTSCFILGSPGETREDIRQTFAFVADSMDAFYCTHFTPLMIFPGTKVWRWALERGVASADNVAGLVMEPDDVRDGDARARFVLDRIPYLNEENIPREEFNTYLQLGWQVERMVADSAYVRRQAHEADRRSRSARHVAEAVPLASILKEKARRRLRGFTS
jgi:radical SAM superfamily enzyme YgiQ (UPF0313 family)